MRDYAASPVYVYRPDALLVWRDPVVKERLSWYYSVMRNERPARFLIARSVESPVNPYESSLSLDELWGIHDELSGRFSELYGKVRRGEIGGDELDKPRWSYLDVKVAIAYRLAEPCRMCERRCGARRMSGEKGVCLVNGKCIVHSYFHHIGEEAPLVPSGTIFYGGCPFKCVFCQNHDISQEKVDWGEAVTPMQLARIQEELRLTGARNINHVGGDPIPHLPFILDSLRHLNVNAPQLWNSNMYMSLEATRLLLDIIDIWLPDLKYGNNSCARRLSLVDRYWEVATRNIKLAHDAGDIIIRHLVMPGHVECCTKPVLEWIARNTPRALVNIMDQYRPEHLVLRHPEKYREIARRPTREEIEEAYRYAEELGIVYKPVS